MILKPVGHLWKKLTICYDYYEIIPIQHHWHGASAHRQLGDTYCHMQLEGRWIFSHGFDYENIFSHGYPFYADFEYIRCTSYKHWYHPEATEVFGIFDFFARQFWKQFDVQCLSSDFKLSVEKSRCLDFKMTLKGSGLSSESWLDVYIHTYIHTLYWASLKKGFSASILKY